MDDDDSLVNQAHRFARQATEAELRGHWQQAIDRHHRAAEHFQLCKSLTTVEQAITTLNLLAQHHLDIASRIQTTLRNQTSTKPTVAPPSRATSRDPIVPSDLSSWDMTSKEFDTSDPEVSKIARIRWRELSSSSSSSSSGAAAAAASVNWQAIAMQLVLENAQLQVSLNRSTSSSSLSSRGTTSDQKTTIETMKQDESSRSSSSSSIGSGSSSSSKCSACANWMSERTRLEKAIYSLTHDLKAEHAKSEKQALTLKQYEEQWRVLKAAAAQRKQQQQQQLQQRQ